MRARSQTKGSPETFSQFVEHVLDCAAPGSRDKRAAVMDACRELLRGGSTFEIDLSPSEQWLYAQALLALLVNDVKKLKGRALLDELRSNFVSDDELERVVGTPWTDSKVQNYVSPTKKKSIYPEAFSALRSRFGVIDELRVAIVESSQLKYVRTIRDAFVRHLRKVDATWEPLETVYGPRSGVLDDPVWEDIVRQIENDHRHDPLDFIVTIGTQASMKIAQCSPVAPQIFLGVTQPIQADLVTSFRAPHARAISGVAYCGENGIKDLVDELSRTFPGRRLVFIYKRGIPQDEHLAESARSLGLSIGVKPTPAFPTLADFIDPSAVFLSWYTFDLMLEEARREALEILKERIVVTTTLSNVKRHPVPVAIAPDDNQIGELGAEMLLRIFEKGIDICSEPVGTPRLKVEFNKDPQVFARLGLQLSDQRTIVRAPRV